LIEINGNDLKIDQIVRVARFGEKVEISETAMDRVRRSRKNLERFLKEKRVMYGINTGFGALGNTRISSENLRKLQLNLLRSHAAGVGDPLEDEEVRAMMLLRLNSLVKGFSGVREDVVLRIRDFLNMNIIPIVPSQGSVGASGDLAPLAHLALPLIGEWKVKYGGRIREASEVLRELKLNPLKLREKEGLALINGTQGMTGVLGLIIHDAEVLVENSILISSMSVDALMGSTTPFDHRIHELRPHKGQIHVAKKLREYMKGSEIRRSHIHCPKVQDAYSLRVIPQVVGAVKDTVDYAKAVCETEINSVTDNPLIFEDSVVSGGNFHGEPVAFVSDFLAIALTELSNISERRIDRLVNPLVSELPPFLAGGKKGLNSGFMLWQYTAASLVSENKVLSHPASVDSIPTSGNLEDHVSMGMNSVLKLKRILRNTEKVVAIELMLAVRALEFRRPLKSSEKIENLYRKVRENVPSFDEDRCFQDDFAKILGMIEKGRKLYEEV